MEGFINGNSCYCGKLTKIVKSEFDQRFDLAYIELNNGYIVIGLLSELLYSKKTFNFSSTSQ